jgi:GntR family transcriptional regulator
MGGEFGGFTLVDSSNALVYCLPMSSRSGLPKYYRISQQIVKRITSGELAPGMQIPSENQIIEHYRVSNTTARKALLEIEKSGWAVRIKGKGTFVRGGSVLRSAGKILSFTRNMIESGYTPSTRVLERGVLQEGYAAVVNGRRWVMKGPVYRIRRLRFGDRTPMLLETRYISLQLCPEIASDSLNGSLYRLYEGTYGHRLTEIHQMLGAVIIDEDCQTYFDSPTAIPGFQLDGVTFCAKELILEMERSIYRGDKYRFAVRALA